MNVVGSCGDFWWIFFIFKISKKKRNLQQIHSFTKTFFSQKGEIFPQKIKKSLQSRIWISYCILRAPCVFEYPPPEKTIVFCLLQKFSEYITMCRLINCCVQSFSSLVKRKRKSCMDQFTHNKKNYKFYNKKSVKEETNIIGYTF